jgi:lambda repressor-like predicted transcriptional regulator
MQAQQQQGQHGVVDALGVQLHENLPSFQGKTVQRAADASSTHFQHMRVDHGGGHAAVTEQLLHRADVIASLQQVRGKGMAQRMRRGRLGDACALHGALEGPLKGLVVQMMAAHHAAARSTEW